MSKPVLNRIDFKIQSVFQTVAGGWHGFFERLNGIYLRKEINAIKRLIGKLTRFENIIWRHVNQLR